MLHYIHIGPEEINLLSVELVFSDIVLIVAGRGGSCVFLFFMVGLSKMLLLTCYAKFTLGYYIIFKTIICHMIKSLPFSQFLAFSYGLIVQSLGNSLVVDVFTIGKSFLLCPKSNFSSNFI